MKMFTATHDKFQQIYIVNSIENDMELIIMVPKGKIKDEDVHQVVKEGLRGMNEQKRYEEGEVGLVLPQFKIGAVDSATPDLHPIDELSGSIVKVGSTELRVNKYMQSVGVELFAPPVSKGNLIVDVDSQKDIAILDEEFLVAVSVNKFENAGVDLPLCVGKVTSDIWRKVKKN